MATFETWSAEQASVRQLVARLIREGEALFSDVAGLVRAEAGGRAADLRRGGVLLAGAAGALVVGLAVASGAAVAALALVIPLLAAALVVAVVELGLAFALLQVGLARLRRVASPPEQTLDVLERGMRSLKAEAEAAAARGAAVSERPHPPSPRVGQPTA